MSGADLSLPLRQAVIAALRASTAIHALVADRIYDAVPAEPTRPYLRYGVPIIVPYEATGIVGSDVDITVHVFDVGPKNDRAYQIAKTVKDALDEASLTITGGYTLSLMWTGSQALGDEEGSAFVHHLVQFNVIIASA